MNSHQPLTSSAGGTPLLELLDAPRAVAALSGYTIATGSSHRVLATAGGGVAIQTWMLDHTFPGPLGRIARELS